MGKNVMRKRWKKNIRKGFRETKCTLCKKEEETLAHICECEEAEENIVLELTDELKQWKEGTEGIELERKVNISLSVVNLHHSF